MSLISARSKFYFYNTMVCLVKAIEGKRIRVDLRGNISVEGYLDIAESTMALNLSNVVLTDVRQRKKTFDKFYIKGRNIVYIHIPDEVDMIAAMKYQMNKTAYQQERERSERTDRFNMKQRRSEKTRERNEKKEARQKEFGGPRHQRHSSHQNPRMNREGRPTARPNDPTATQGRNVTCSVDRGVSRQQRSNQRSFGSLGGKEEVLQSVKDFMRAPQVAQTSDTRPGSSDRSGRPAREEGQRRASSAHGQSIRHANYDRLTRDTAGRRDGSADSQPIKHESKYQSDNQNRKHTDRDVKRETR